MAHSYVRDWRREKERRSEEGVRGTERTSDRADYSASGERDNYREGHTGPNKKRDSAAKKVRKERERGIRLADDAREGTRRGKGEKAGEGCTEGKANDTTASRAFSDVVDRRETIATENRKEGDKDTSGCGTPEASHGTWLKEEGVKTTHTGTKRIARSRVKATKSKENERKGPGATRGERLRG